MLPSQSVLQLSLRALAHELRPSYPCQPRTSPVFRPRRLHIAKLFSGAWDRSRARPSRSYQVAPGLLSPIAVSMCMLSTSPNKRRCLGSSKKTSPCFRKGRKATARDISVVGSDEKRRCWSCGVWRHLHSSQHAYQSSH